jgi:hypothetical protein
VPKDILNMYGPDTHQPQPARASHGGRMPTRDVRNYCPPQGPSNINDPKSPGLHGMNHGNDQCQYSGREGGHAGISSEKHPKGSQR